MESLTIQIVLTILVLSVALNLFLTFRMFSVLKDIPMVSANQRLLEAGDLVPDFKGQTLIDKREVLSEQLQSQPMVIVFVAPGCPKCKDKLPELHAILPAMQIAGVGFWLIAMGNRWSVQRFLKDSELHEQTLLIDAESRKQLNPNRSSPFYLFIDENRILQASGLIGDENWLSFMQQMQELKA